MSMQIALFGRHPSPAEEIIWPEGIPDSKMTDYGYMHTVCTLWLRLTDTTNRPNDDGLTHQNLRLYVEGFTPALIAFLKAWEVYYGGMTPTLLLMHYQPDGTYLQQRWQT